MSWECLVFPVLSRWLNGNELEALVAFRNRFLSQSEEFIPSSMPFSLHYQGIKIPIYLVLVFIFKSGATLESILGGQWEPSEPCLDPGVRTGSRDFCSGIWRQELPGPSTTLNRLFWQFYFLQIFFFPLKSSIPWFSIMLPVAVFCHWWLCPAKRGDTLSTSRIWLSTPGPHIPAVAFMVIPWKGGKNPGFVSPLQQQLRGSTGWGAGEHQDQDLSELLGFQSGEWIPPLHITQAVKISHFLANWSFGKSGASGKGTEVGGILGWFGLEGISTPSDPSGVLCILGCSFGMEPPPLLS